MTKYRLQVMKFVPVDSNGGKMKISPLQLSVRIVLLGLVFCLFLNWTNDPWRTLGQCFTTPGDPRTTVVAPMTLLSAIGYFFGFWRLRKKPSLGFLGMFGRLYGWSILFGGIFVGFCRLLFSSSLQWAALLQSLLFSSGLSFYPALIGAIIFKLGQRITGNLHK